MNKTNPSQQRKLPDILRGSIYRWEKSIFSDGWNLLWFNMEGDKLCFYKDKNCLEHLGYYDLSSKGITVHPTSYGKPIMNNKSTTEGKFEFQLNIPKIPKVQDAVSVFLAVSEYSQLWYWVDGLIQWTTIFRKAYERRKQLPKNSSQTEFQFDLVPYQVSMKVQGLVNINFSDFLKGFSKIKIIKTKK